MTMVPVYLLVLIIFMNRYFGGLLLARVLKRTELTADWYRPTVTVVVPTFNEGSSIYRTISSLIDQDYPPSRLSIFVVDDCSTDDSFAHAQRAAQDFPDQVQVSRNPHNMGKRRSINRAVRLTESEIIVSVDSDVFVERDAIRELMRRFVAPEIAAVGGRVDVSNANENWLSRMQAIKYYFGYVYLKNLERTLNSVMCLSGCLTAYRRRVLLELEPLLENRSVLGIPIKYGEDRFLTRQIVKAGYKTTLTLDARCATKAPTTLDKYFAQQLRWRRSNLIDYMLGMSHAWKLHPIIAVHYVCMFGLLLAYPLLVFINIVEGQFFAQAAVHCAVLMVFGLIYQLDSDQVAPERRVHPLWFVSLGVIMPVTYLLHTVLALFTLDTGSWETRGHLVQSETPADADPGVSPSES